MKFFLVILIVGFSHADVIVDNHEAIHRCIANLLENNKDVREAFEACHANNGPDAHDCIMKIKEIADCFKASRSGSFKSNYSKNASPSISILNCCSFLEQLQ